MGVTTVSNSIILIILGGWVTKGLKNRDEKLIGGGGGGRAGDNNILTFLCYWLYKKMPHSKTFWAIFSIRICKVS